MALNDSDRRDLRAALRRAGLRIRIARGISGAVVGGLSVHAALVPWLVLKSVWPIGWTEYALAVGATVALGAALSGLRAVPARHAARALDRNLGLSERLTTALEFETRPYLRLVYPLLADAAAHARKLSVAAAIPLAPPAASTYAATAAVAISLLLVWLPPIPLVTPVSAGAAPDAGSEVAAETVASRERASTFDIPHRQAVQPATPAHAIEFKDSPIEIDPEALERLLRAGDDRHGLLDLADRLPSLRIGSEPGSTLAALAGAASPPAADLSARRYSRAEAAKALGELESLWGSARQRDSAKPPPLQPVRDEPEEGGPAGQPEGGEPVNREASENEPPEEMPLNPDEERLTPPSDRFASLPESTDAAASDLPPWPKDGPGDGIDDDSRREEEGTGRNSGEPGTGFTNPLRGSIADRIDNEHAPEIELAGLHQDGAHQSFATDLTGRVAPGQARLTMQDMRSRFTRRAEQTLNEEWIPLEARGQIKRYFESIQARR